MPGIFIVLPVIAFFAAIMLVVLTENGERLDAIKAELDREAQR